MQLNRPCAATMRPYVKLRCPLAMFFRVDFIHERGNVRTVGSAAGRFEEVM